METPPELDHERVLGFLCHTLQNSLLSQSMLELLVRQDMTLGDSLERVQVRAHLMPHQQDLARTTLPKDTHHLKVVDDGLSLRLLLAVRVA